MYELISKILDTAKENDVDVGVAYDYIVNEDGYSSELADARDFLSDEYETITALRKAGREVDIKIICDMKEQGNDFGMETFIKHLDV